MVTEHFTSWVPGTRVNTLTHYLFWFPKLDDVVITVLAEEDSEIFDGRDKCAYEMVVLEVEREQTDGRVCFSN